MTTDEASDVVSEAARQLPGHLAIILVTSFAVAQEQDGTISLVYDSEFVEDAEADAIKAAFEDAMVALGHAGALH